MWTVRFLCICLVCACAGCGSPPKPPGWPSGEERPINPQHQTNSPAR